MNIRQKVKYVLYVEYANVLSDCPCKCLTTTSTSGVVHDALLEYCGRHVWSLLHIQVRTDPVMHNMQVRAEANCFLVCVGHIETEWQTLHYVNCILRQRQATGV